MTNLLDPYDAILVVSFGGPSGPDEVMPFLRRVAQGRPIPEERLLEVATHYESFGGVSPIVANTDEFVAALSQALSERGITTPIVLGNRNAPPFITDAIRDLHTQGARRILCLLTSAYASYSGCRQYREDLAAAVAELGPAGDELEFAKIAPFHTSPGWIKAQVEAIAPALADPAPTKVLFTTHSIPTAMNAAAGPDGSRTYVEQHQESIDLICRELDRELDWELVYCSRSGSPRTPWLEPDICDRISELPTTDPAIKRIVVVPFGFLNDHMEVVSDLDHEAAEAAAEAGFDFVRVPTAHVQEPLLGSLIDSLLTRAAQARGENVTPESLGQDWHTICPQTCCLPEPHITPTPALCQED